MYCKECGTINYNKEEFCKKCGAPLVKPLAKKMNKNNSRKDINGYDFNDDPDIKSYSEISDKLDYSIKKSKRNFDNNVVNTIKSNNGDYSNQKEYSKSNSNAYNRANQYGISQKHRRVNQNKRANNNKNFENQYAYKNEYKGVITDNGYNYKSKNDGDSEIYNDGINSYKSLKDNYSGMENQTKTLGDTSEVKITEANFKTGSRNTNLDNSDTKINLLEDIPKQWIIIGVATIAIILALFAIIFATYRKNVAAKQYNNIIKQGVEYMDEGDYDSAIERFSLAITKDSKKENGYIYLAQAYISQGMEAEAIALLEQAYLSLNSSKIKTQLDILRNNNENNTPVSTADAKEMEESSTETDSEEEVYYQLGYNAFLNKNYDDAKKYFSRIRGYKDSQSLLNKIQENLDTKDDETSEKNTTKSSDTKASTTEETTTQTTAQTQSTTAQTRTTTTSDQTTSARNQTVTSSEQISSTAASSGFTWSGDYIIANSSTTRLTENDLAKYTAEQLRYARNEIYARHGYIFNNQELLNYFKTKSWYKPTISADSFNQASLNDIEKANVDLMNTVEATKK